MSSVIVAFPSPLNAFSCDGRRPVENYETPANGTV